MGNFIEWNKLEFKKSGGIEKLRCPKCDDVRSDKKDKSLVAYHNDGVAKCFYCDALSFRDSEKKERQTRVNYTLPPQEFKNHTTLSDKLVKWFESRGIKQYVLKDYNITEEEMYQPKHNKSVNNVVFNYFEGELLVNKKYRSAKKEFTQTKGGKPILYNINSAIGQEELYIVEGEMDVLSLIQIGIKNVVSLPSGANDNDAFWINSEEYIKGIKKFFIGTDNDEKGNAVAEKIAQRLGRYRCERVLWEGKDANEDLLSGVLEETVLRRDKYPIVGTYSIDDIWDKVLELAKNGLPETIKPKGLWCKGFNEIFSTMRGHLVTGTGIPSHGKALDINTLIPTENGFKKLFDLKIGDCVFDENGDKCFVKWKSEVWKNRPTYKITFSDNSTIIADENHEWLTDTFESRRYANCKESIKTTKEIFNTLKHEKGKKNNHSIKISKPINISNKELLIHPYVLGCWLGDGTSSGCSFTTNDVEIIDNIKERGYNVKKRSDKYGYGIVNIFNKLKELNLLNNKHIPNDYLFSSTEQRIELLRGLMDTDGHCSILEARNEYCGTNYKLVRSVYQLICSLGIKATFIESDAKLNGKVVSKRYRVFFKTNKKIFNLTRKQNIIYDYFKTRSVRGNDVRYITNCEMVNGYETQCIEVDSKSHLFLAGEQFIPTHNSNFTDWYVLNLINDYDMKASWFSPEHSPMELYVTNLATKAIGTNFFKATSEQREDFKTWSKEKIYLTNAVGGQEPNWEWLLETFQNQMLRYGIDIFVIDAWNKVVLNDKNELQGIRRVLTKLTSFAQQNNVIVFLIAHPTKMKKSNGSENYDIPTLYDVAGSADFRNQTHDGYCVYRYFDQGKTTLINLKTKMSFQGDIGKNADFYYNMDNGRYYDCSTQKNNMPLWYNGQESAITPSASSFAEQSTLTYFDDEVPF